MFSTYVEMIPCLIHSSGSSICVLHVCGDDPFCQSISGSNSWCSPRMWRWSHDDLLKLYLEDVFSTYVEMILNLLLLDPTFYCVLHVCGDDPTNQNLIGKTFGCSPRMWRWSCCFEENTRIAPVFSTYVEMILGCGSFSFFLTGVLHVCGDDPLLVMYLYITT